ncbi:hypothetical protein HWC36_gp27 [Corynebacterium phage StAB]|uniref:Lipoprotein n=1 Tax=Corynebacterium phage StAB TaxID=2591204 RepID=A0A514DJF9_9CAUD|nr:hypothetical protein HWC36_gp27 [Corynebacterium phage StAB]QDH93738.1 hypothetical protein SEA_STAB_27 [Corynebacterium phage StAB]
MTIRTTAALGVAALALAGCASQHPEPVAYETVADLQSAADAAGLECQWAQPGPVLPARVAAYRECTDAAGARPAAVLFSDDADQQSRLDEYRSSATWAQKFPAILVGPQWNIECPSLSACEPWRDALGGHLVEAPDY